MSQTQHLLVRCQLRGAQPEGASEYTPCTLSGRTIVMHDSHEVHSAFSIAPQSLPPDARLASPPVGVARWPIEKVSTEMTAAAEAVQSRALDDGYALLADLGLELDPRDADMLLQ